MAGFQQTVLNECETLLAAIPSEWAGSNDYKFESVEQYLELQDDFLLEDFMNPLRDVIQNYKYNQRPESYKSARVFKNIRLTCVEKGMKCGREVIFCTIAKSHQPSFGRILLFTRKDFVQDLFLGKVVSDPSKSSDVRIELKQFRETQQGLRMLKQGTFTMMEADPFLSTYVHLSKSLRSMDECTFPMKEYIVYGDQCTKVKPPAYLKSTTMYRYTATSPSNVRVLGQNEWPLFSGLDEDQSKAVQRALTEEMALIEGPAGTGKTRIAIQTVQILLSNKSVWSLAHNRPILVVCKSNAVLDEFLERLLGTESLQRPFGLVAKPFIRIGDQCQSEALMPFTLKKVLQRAHFGNSTESAMDLLRSHVIGITSSDVSAHREILDHLKPPIVIIEEAEEVLESHVVASITQGCQHLIMLGDRRQLKRPVCANGQAEDHLNMSLFERLLVKQVVEDIRLTTEYRMRPEMTSLLRPHIYGDLHDSAISTRRSPVDGVLKSVFFLDHGATEESADGNSGFYNRHEVTMLIELAKYLVYLKYSPSDITILSMYNDQKNRLVQAQNQNPGLKNIQIATVDNYCGKENRFVLLSLVRSNHTGNIGFVKEEKRVTLALSRAKDGLFIMGNMKCLTQEEERNNRSPKMWTILRDRLRSQDAISAEFPLICYMHGCSKKVSTPRDWDQVFCIPCSALVAVQGAIASTAGDSAAEAVSYFAKSIWDALNK